MGPEALVVLGATAGKSLFGASFRITKVRARQEQRRAFRADLATVASALTI